MTPTAHDYDQLWQDYCAIKAHLKLLSKVVLDGNASAALAFAIQTEGILESFKKTCTP